MLKHIIFILFSVFTANVFAQSSHTEYNLGLGKFNEKDFNGAMLHFN